MLDLKTAIAKICQLPPEQQKLVIQFVEYLDKETESDRNKSLQEKIQAAINASENTPPVDGENFINGILERFKKE